MTRCTKCILPDGYPGISLDEAGVCNFCSDYKGRKYLGKEAFQDRINSFIKNNKAYNDDYDCLLGFSGGKDSSYLLHYLVKIMDLRVLCYSADNGFIPEQTKINMKNITSLMNTELIIEEHDHLKKCIKHHIRAWIHHPSPAMVGVLCAGCRLGITSGKRAYAKKFRIPVVISGGTPIDSQTGYKYNIMKLDPKSKAKVSFILGYLDKLIRNPRWILNPNCLATQVKEYYVHFSNRSKKKKRALQISPFYTYIKWTEKEVISTIQNELGWKKDPRIVSTARGDCDIALLKAYLYKKTLGFNDKDCELSALIRDGQITREEALNRLNREGDISEELIEEIFDDFGLDYIELENALKKYQNTVKASLLY